MKIIIGITMLLSISVSCVLAEDTTNYAAVAVSSDVAETQVMTYSGDIIDNTCVQSNQNNLANIALTYSKEDALTPGCAKNGYSLYTNEGKLLEFTKKSFKKIEQFLLKRNSTIRVIITAQVVNNKLRLITIQNQK